MPDSMLMAHTPGSRYVNAEELRNLPAPEVLGPRHRPVPHYELLTEAERVLNDQGWFITRRQMAVARNGAQFFGLFDLVNDHDGASGTEQSTSFGLRTSTNSTLAIRGVAGQRLFICDNLSFAGDEFVLHRKLTTGLDLTATMELAVSRFTAQTNRVRADLQSMKVITLTTIEAKVAIFNLFHKEVMPKTKFDEVADNYFSPESDWDDCKPRTLFGLHNAVTRAARDMKPAAKFSATVRIGRFFRIAV